MLRKDFSKTSGQIFQTKVGLFRQKSDFPTIVGVFQQESDFYDALGRASQHQGPIFCLSCCQYQVFKKKYSFDLYTQGTHSLSGYFC
jgi:hypothetical protein